MKWFTTLLELLGVGVAVAGVWLIYVPAALILGGLAMVALAWAADRDVKAVT